MTPLNISILQYQGEDLKGKHILVCPEQGIGDEAMDLVISIDNSTVHFAGALGINTFVMLPFNQDWRWAEDRSDSYWYPNMMQLFRQQTDGDWDGDY